MDDAQLLAAIDELLRTVPPYATMHHGIPENFEWFGRLKTVMGRWQIGTTKVVLSPLVDSLQSGMGTGDDPYNRLMTLLHEARYDLMIKTGGPQTVAFEQGRVFGYFDSVRKIIETAQSDLLFVDRYMGADFVSFYLPHVKPGVHIRLLTRDKLGELLPVVELFARQDGAMVEVRSSDSIHDRFVFVDQGRCYQSGASFKDGARLSPTTVSEVVDAAQLVFAMYEDYWVSGRVERGP